MLWYNDKISLRQLQVLIIINIFGTGVILLPMHVVQMSAQDGWIVVLISTIFALLCMFIITGLVCMFPNKSFYEYTTKIATKPIAFILSIGLIARLVLQIGLTLRVSIEIINHTMLPHTPYWIMALLIILLSGYGASKGYETRARLAEILIIIILLPILFVFLVAAFNVDYTNLLPVFEASPTTLIKSGFLSLNAFIGIELLLLVGPYVYDSSLIRKKASVSLIILGIIMASITLITIARFGVPNLKNQMWPVIQMMDSTNLPGSFIQRQGVLIMSFFIISVFAIVNACLFFSSLVLKSIVKKGSHGFYIILCMIISFLICLVPNNMVEVYNYMDAVFYSFGLGYMLFIPSILLILAKIRGDAWVKVLILAVLAVGLFFLVGCDKKEMEERAYVLALGIDIGPITTNQIEEKTDDKIDDKKIDQNKEEQTKEENNDENNDGNNSDNQKSKDTNNQELLENSTYSLTIVKAATTEDDENNNKPIYSSANSIPNALSKVSLKGNQDIYLGIAQTIVIGQEVLKDPSHFIHVMDTLSRNKDLSKDAYLLATSGNASEIITKIPQGKTGPTSSKFHKNNHTTLNQLQQKTLEDISASLATTGGALIPIVEMKDSYLDITGMYIITNFALQGILPKEYIHGYLLSLGEGVGYTLTAHLNNSPIAFDIYNINQNLDFTEDDDGLVFNIDLNVFGTIEGYNLETLTDECINEAKKMYEQIIDTQILIVYNKLYESTADPLRIKENLRKKNNALYKKYNESIEIKLATNINVEIESIGSIK